MGAAAWDFHKPEESNFSPWNRSMAEFFTTRARTRFNRIYVQSFLILTCAGEGRLFFGNNCSSEGIAISTRGASFGGVPPANILFKHPTSSSAVFGVSCVYDLVFSWMGNVRRQFYFNNPVDYLSNASVRGSIAKSKVVTFTSTVLVRGDRESVPTASLSSLRQRNPHSLDNWGRRAPRLAVLEGTRCANSIATLLIPVVYVSAVFGRILSSMIYELVLALFR